MLTPGGINKLNVSTDYGVTWSIVTSPVNGDAYCIDESPPLSTSPPVADFYAYDTTPIINTDVPFKDVSTNTPTSWAWVFTPNTITYKSGSSSTSQDPTVEFDAAGLYTVQLTATNAYGSDAEIKTNYINASVYTAPPDADFHATNTTPDVGVEIQFIDDSTNTPTSWEWLIYPETSGDWTWTTDNAAQNPFITFNDSGYYTIKLTATNAGGSDVAIKTNYIHVGNDLMTNIVSYWKFANSGLIDSHGTNDGIGENMAGNPIGIIDQAIHFNGTSALVKLPCVDPLPDTCGKFEYNDFSISIWFNMDTYPEAGGAFYSMFSKWSSTGSEYSDYAVIVFKYSNGDMGIEFQVNGSAGGDQDVTWVAGSMSLTWNHLVVVKNGTSLKIYFNGELKETDICSATLIFSSAAPRMGVVQQYVGVAPYGFFDGALDEIGFWSRGLTAAEVTLLYNSGAGYQYPFT